MTEWKTVAADVARGGAVPPQGRGTVNRRGCPWGGAILSGENCQAHVDSSCDRDLRENIGLQASGMVNGTDN